MRRLFTSCNSSTSGFFALGRYNTRLSSASTTDVFLRKGNSTGWSPKPIFWFKTFVPKTSSKLHSSMSGDAGIIQNGLVKVLDAMDWSTTKKSPCGGKTAVPITSDAADSDGSFSSSATFGVQHESWSFPWPNFLAAVTSLGLRQIFTWLSMAGFASSCCCIAFMTFAFTIATWNSRPHVQTGRFWCTEKTEAPNPQPFKKYLAILKRQVAIQWGAILPLDLFLGLWLLVGLPLAWRKCLCRNTLCFTIHLQPNLRVRDLDDGAYSFVFGSDHGHVLLETRRSHKVTQVDHIPVTVQFPDAPG